MTKAQKPSYIGHRQRIKDKYKKIRDRWLVGRPGCWWRRTENNNRVRRWKLKKFWVPAVNMKRGKVWSGRLYIGVNLPSELFPQSGSDIIWLHPDTLVGAASLD